MVYCKVIHIILFDISRHQTYTYLMLARVYSCAVIGLEGVIVEVEVDTGQGLPSMVIVSLLASLSKRVVNASNLL